MKYFLGLSSTFSFSETLKHTFAFGNEFDLSELRAYLAAHYGATYDHVAVFANGRTALAVALKAVAKRGGKVAVTSMTCYAVVQAVKAAGCIPVFADIDPKTLHFGKKELLKVLETERDVQAVIVQNNLGIPADIEGIEEVAKKYKLSIIEDLAHCAGVRYADGREAGTVGRATILSFGKGKAIDVVSGGAVILTDPLDSPVNQPEIKPVFKERFRARFYPLFSAIIRGGYGISNKFGKILTGALVKIHAIKKSADADVNTKVRINFWQAKLALRKLHAISHAGRKPLRDYYLVNDRDKVLAELEKKGYIFHDIWYDTPVAPERYFHKVDYHPEMCPVATKIATQIVNVPTWYRKKDLVPALRIIKKDLVDDDAISETEIETDELTKNEVLKNYKNDKKALGKKKTGKDKKSEKQAEKDKKSKKKSKRGRRKEAKGSSEVIEDEIFVNGSANKTPEEIQAEIEKRVRQEVKRELEKASAKKAVTEEISAKEVIAKKEVYEQTPTKKTASEKIVSERTIPERATLEQEQKPDYRDDKIATDSMTGMKVAPRKLSEREKIKRDLEAGAQGEQNVI